MKKIAFVLQSFALIALLPICVALEMNHTTVTLPGNNTHSGVKERGAKITILVSLNLNVQNNYPVPCKLFIVSTGRPGKCETANMQAEHINN